MKSFHLILEECLTMLSNGIATVDECLARYPQYAEQLKPFLRTVRFLKLGRNVKPTPAFKSSSSAYLTQYLRFNPRHPQKMHLSRQVVMAFAVLMTFMLFTSIAHAQSVLPGNNFYSLKRASEEIWRSLSADLVNTDIALSERRFNEWMAVADDPILSPNAQKEYMKELGRLTQRDNAQIHKLIVPVIKKHREALDDAGLPGGELVNAYLTLQPTPSLNTIITQVPATNTAVFIPADTPQPTATFRPEPTATEPPPVATEPMPSDEPTLIPTEPAPTATPVEPTTVPIEPTATLVEPTSVPTDPTAIPVDPTATGVPAPPGIVP